MFGLMRAYRSRMPLREFVDASGVSWRVWDTAPGRLDGLALAYQRGWLTFDNGTERFRLAPIPADWDALSDERLALLLRVAEPPKPHDSGGSWHGDERRVRDRRLGDRRANPPGPPSIDA